MLSWAGSLKMLDINVEVFGGNAIRHLGLRR
jgi:hypothetical protein